MLKTGSDGNTGWLFWLWSRPWGSASSSTVPELLKGLMLSKAIVTVDAMNCQKVTAAAVMEGGGDYIFALKGNQGRLHEEARLFLDEMASEVPICYLNPER